jgi:hypothetical protein
MSWGFFGGNVADPFGINKQIADSMAKTAEDAQRNIDKMNADIMAMAEQQKKTDAIAKAAAEADWKRVQDEQAKIQASIAAQFQYQPQPRRGIFGEYLGTW